MTRPPTTPTSACKPRGVLHRLSAAIKRARTLVFSHSVALRRPRAPRARARMALTIMLAALALCVLGSALTRRASTTPWRVRIARRMAALSDFLPAGRAVDLRAPARHFDPPSRFAPHVCVRHFDTAWRLLHGGCATRASLPGGALPRRARLAYAIQASGESVALLPRLLARVHHARNVYVVHLDAKVSVEKRRQFGRLIASSSTFRRNVHVLPSEMLTYRGISSVLNSLALMTLALEKCAEWEYYINISASDYPLLSVDDVAEMLVRPDVQLGRLNFVWFFPRYEWKPYSFRISKMVWDPAASGYQDARTSLHYMRGQKMNPMDESRAFVFTKAEAWSILSRPFVTFLMRSSFAKRMLLAHMHVLSVSEHLVTDILFNHPLWRTTIVSEAFRKVVWYFRGKRSGQHPYSLDRGPNLFSFWTHIQRSHCIFARKLTLADSPLMDRIDAELSGIALNRSDARWKQFESSRQRFLNGVISQFDRLTSLTLKQQHFFT